MRVLGIDPLTIVPFDKTPTFKPFLAECVDVARQRGYLVDGLAFQEKHIHIGAAVGHYTYLHHKGTKSHDIPVLSSLIMAFYYCIDDYCFEAQSLAEYGVRLASGRPQREKGLDDLVALSAEIAGMYDPITGDLLGMSTQAYVMGNHLEREMCGTSSQWRVNKDAPYFPTIMKTITSAATTLFLLSFSCDVPSVDYIQSLPDGILVHDFTAYVHRLYLFEYMYLLFFRDIMSYYKEAIEGEFNRVEQAAQIHGVTGPEMLEEFVRKMTLSHERVSRVLLTTDPSGKLLSCYQSTIVGFIVFQALHPRYKITDLLGVSESSSFAFGLQAKLKPQSAALSSRLAFVPSRVGQKLGRGSINHLLIYVFFIILSSYLSIVWYPTLISKVVV
ncbi:hypothetical protein DFH05DRAFT_1512854 [Lentinula detonsa]|uniref:Terpenoid synthase n=1 Tax=Lentinula detonsa TaxID=2804962 RepID=A0A9W8NS85_9AGAR|nr:hypothetical protein DFH05DRAFT_1512854 [Lentinula detonsa]